MGKRIGIAIVLILLVFFSNLLCQIVYNKTWIGSASTSIEINPFDPINLLFTSIITIWLGIYIGKRLTEQRYEKEYLISDLRDIEQQVCFIENSTTQSAKVEIQTVLDLLNKLRITLERFAQTLDIFKIQSVDVQALNNHYLLLYRIATNLDGSYLVWDDENKNEMQKICSDLVVTSRNMIFTINKR